MATAKNITFDQLQQGQSTSLQHRLTRNDLLALAGQISASDPERMTASFGTHPLFHEFIAQGLWGSATIAAVALGRLPGPGTALLAQNLVYARAVAIGDVVTTTLTVAELREDNQVLLDCRAETESGELVTSGTLLVRAPTQSEQVVEDARQKAPSTTRRSHFEALLRMTRNMQPIKTGVVHPVDKLSLMGALDAARRELIEPILIGPKHKILAAAEEAGEDISSYQLISTRHSHAAAAKAAEMAAAGDVEALMKGALRTGEMIRAVLSQDSLKTERRVSHVWATDVPTYPRLLLLTDAAINVAPNLYTKRDITQNAIDLAHALGIDQPKVAILAATEEVKADMSATMDAAALCKMSERGQITGGLLDGPLAFDNAISEEAAKTKKILSPVAGYADIFVAPDIEAGNLLGKQLNYLADAEIAGIVLGAQVPIILTSRADSIYARSVSSALALLMAQWKKQQAAQEEEQWLKP